MSEKWPHDNSEKHAEAARKGWRGRMTPSRMQIRAANRKAKAMPEPTTIKYRSEDEKKEEAYTHYANEYASYLMGVRWQRVAQPAILSSKENAAARKEARDELRRRGIAIRAR